MTNSKIVEKGDRTVYSVLAKYLLISFIFCIIRNVLAYQKHLFWIFHKV